MEFKLTINLDEGGMLTYADLRKALKCTARYMKEYRGKDESYEPGDSATIKDPSGKVVGKWEIA